MRNSASGADRIRTAAAAAGTSGPGGRVAFAAAAVSSRVAEQPAGDLDHPPTAVATGGDSSSSKTSTPFASSHVQEKHHSAISRQEWKQQKLHKAHRQHRRHKGQQQQQVQQWSSGSSAGSSSSSSKGPLYRTRSGPALSELKDVSSAGQVIRMAGRVLWGRVLWGRVLRPLTGHEVGGQC